jgi:phosphate transport system protein
MRECLKRGLEQLKVDLLALAASVEESVHEAIRALRQRDLGLARKVIAGDDAIDRTENKIHQECLRLLALHQPVAGDLRRVTASMSITTDLERMGDLASAMAGRAVALADQAPLRVPARLEVMAGLVTAMVRRSVDAFGRLDAPLARSVCRADDEVDQLNVEIINELIDAMKARAEAVEPGLSLFSVVRQLERIADHATNIAEGVVYLVEGEILRHHPETLSPERV